MRHLSIGILVAALSSLFEASAAQAANGQLETTFSGTVYDFALNPHNAELYASTDTGVLVIDTATLTQEGAVPISGAPRGVAVSPDGTRLYVATGSAQSLAVVDLATLSVVDTITLPTVPSDVEVGSGGRIYVTPGYSGNYRGIMLVDGTTGTYVKDFDGGVFVYYSGLLRISPDGNLLYFANRGLSPGTLAKFDVSTANPVKLYQNDHGSLGSNGQDLWLTPDRKYVYYAVGGGNFNYDIARIRTFDMTVQGSLKTGAYPRQITTSPDGKSAYTVHTSGVIDVWNTETQASIGGYPVSGEASRLIVDHSGNHLFAAFPGGLRVYRAEGSTPVVDDDHDGVEDVVDNCVGLANPSQGDADGDHLGDDCDPFPNDANHEFAQCRIDRADRDASLLACSTGLAACSADLFACTRSIPTDSDGDGEFDVRDECPQTPSGAPIDAAGCSRAQFCASYSGSVPQCLAADWNNDQPRAANPGDCTFVPPSARAAACVAK